MQYSTYSGSSYVWMLMRVMMKVRRTPTQRFRTQRSSCDGQEYKWGLRHVSLCSPHFLPLSYHISQCGLWENTQYTACPAQCTAQVTNSHPHFGFLPSLETHNHSLWSLASWIPGPFAQLSSLGVPRKRERAPMVESPPLHCTRDYQSCPSSAGRLSRGPGHHSTHIIHISSPVWKNSLGEPR